MIKGEIMTDVQRQNVDLFHAPLPAQPNGAGSLMEVISRAASDPATDVSKLERLLGMYERITAQDAKRAYTAALIAMKPKLPVIDRKGRIEVREKTSSGKRDGDISQSTPYALWEDIDQAITPILAEHEFALTFRSGVAQDGKITVTGILSHSAGHSEETTMTLPHDSSGSKNAVQAVGSSTKYGMRYTAILLLNIRTRGEDDDGKAGGTSGEIDDSQLDHLNRGCDRFGAKKGEAIEKLCVHFKIGALPDLPAVKFREAMEMINTKPSAPK